MKKAITHIVSLILCAILTNIVLAEENLPMADELQMPLSEHQMPGRIEDIGTHFELTDSEYLNISLDSTEPIKLVLESVPEMVTLHVESPTGATSTQITLGGFQPLTTYYKYEDDYHNLVPFTTDGVGRYDYIQDLSKPHLVFIQPHPSTIFLTDEGWSEHMVGTWDPLTRTAILIKNINQTIQIDADNLTLDGNNHTISGSDTGSGIYLYGRTGVTIKNLNIRQFSYGIYFYSSNNNTLTNTMANDNFYGIYLRYSSNNPLINNTTISNKYGINISYSNYNTLTKNNTSNNEYYGIYFSGSGSNTLKDNTMSGNRYNFEVRVSSYLHFNNDIDTSNLVEGKPIYYLVGASGTEINSSSNAGIVYCINCNNITVKDLILTNNYKSIFLHNTINSRIENNDISTSNLGIYLYESSNNTLINNNIGSNEYGGIFLYSSNNNTLAENNTYNNSSGISLNKSSDNTISGNLVNNNNYSGISLYYSNNNTLRGNNVSNNEYGILLSPSHSSLLTHNNTDSNVYGLYISYSSYNTISKNNANNNRYGFYFFRSSNNILANNNNTNSERDGIHLRSSNNNALLENKSTYSYTGVDLYVSGNNTIAGNDFSNNNWEGLILSYSNNNILTNNNITLNGYYGIRFYSSCNDNIIYLNNFINNFLSAYSSTDSLNNVWNSPRPIAYTYNDSEYVNYLGNYWSDYEGTDANFDGIGDVPYTINLVSDYYPLMQFMQLFEFYIPTLPITESTMNETESSTYALFETIISQNATLTTSVIGDLNGVLNFTSLENVLIDSGSFAGKGFSKGNWSADIEGNSYDGSWQGILFKKPGERKIYLKGTVSGGLKGIVEGYLLESISGSGIYDQYQASWTISQIGTDIVFAKIDLNGTMNYQDSTEYLSEELYVLQASIKGGASGYYNGPLSVILTHVRIDNETNPYYGQGFSIISYVSQAGSGEGWTYDRVIESGKVELKGIFTSPLLGIISATLNETTLPRKLLLTIERVDLGLPAAPDLKVRVWGPGRVSPGQTVNYIIEYRNDGLKAADEVFISCYLDTLVKYISASEGVYYSPYAHRLSWKIGNLSAKTVDYLSFRVEVVWGLPEGFPLEQNAYIINIGE